MICSGARAYVRIVVNNSCLIELHYLPCVAYLSLFFRYEKVIIEKHEHYQKRSYRNRCHIGTSSGMQALSIPLRKGKNQQQRIVETVIAYDMPWHAQHCHALQSAYGSAPFFHHYYPEVEARLNAHPSYLYTSNLDLLRWTLAMVQAPGQLIESSHYAKETGFDDYRNSILPSATVTLPSYPQVFSDRLPFLSNLSVFDLLVHLGPESHAYLQHSGVQK